MSQSPEVHADVHARIARLFVYPVKSCAGIEVEQAVLTETGLDLDRAWMVVDESGEFVTQREEPRLALVQPQFRRGGSELVLRAPGMLPLHLRTDVAEAPARVRVWDDEVPAWDMGDVAAQWFSDFLSLNAEGLPGAGAERYRLVRFDPEHRRLSSMQWTAGEEALNQFSDGFAVLVTSQASLDELNARLQQAGYAPVGMERFRANLVLEGLPAHDEDRLDTLHVAIDGGAKATLRLVKPCPRCTVPNIDPATALSSPEVGDTLQGYRQNPLLNGAVAFGMNAIVTGGVDRVLMVGQEVSANYRFE